MEALLPWIVAVALLALVAAMLIARQWPRKRGQQLKPLPTDWALAPRPVFSTDERRVYRQLREALPHHIVLSKLPLVRFCQPTDPNEVRYWYELLGSIHISFAICSANGRVLAAIDLDTDRGNSRRILQIKQSVLGACRVRYLRCPVDNLPSVAELQLLVPQAAAASRGPQPAPVQPRTRSEEQSSSVSRRRERAALWQDSSFFQDSFFAPDNRLDVSSPDGSNGFDPSRIESARNEGRSSRAMPLESREANNPAGAILGDGDRFPGTGTHN
jgi:Protein of unknown function (DUF2726)